MINREGADSVRLVRRPPLPSPLPSFAVPRREEGWSTQHASSRRRPPAPPARGAHYGGNEGKNGTGCYCASPGQPKNFSTAKICPKTLPPSPSAPLLLRPSRYTSLFLRLFSNDGFGAFHPSFWSIIFQIHFSFLREREIINLWFNRFISKIGESLITFFVEN